MFDVITIVDSTIKPTTEYINELKIIYPDIKQTIYRDVISITDYVMPIQSLPIKDSVMLRDARDIDINDDINSYRYTLLDDAKLTLLDSSTINPTDNITPYISNTTDSLKLVLLDSAVVNIYDEIRPYNNIPLFDGVILILRDGG